MPPPPPTPEADDDGATKASLASADEPIAPFAPTADEPSALLNRPLDVRSASVLVLAVLASLVALKAAKGVFVPLVLGVMLSYALTPLVNRMVRIRIPRTLAAAALLLAIVGGIGSLAYSFSDDAVSLIETLPKAAQKLRRSLQRQGHQLATADRVQQAAAELERVTEVGAGSGPTPSDVPTVQIEKPRFDVKDYFLPGALGLAAAAGQTAVVFFISFFLLASGDTFRRKMVKLAGPTLARKKITLQALDEIDGQIQRYLLVQTVTSALVGVATWLAFLWIGVEHAAVWGITAFAFNFIPYLGSAVVAFASTLTGFVQFGSLGTALLIGGCVLLISSLEGYLLTPVLTGRAGRMNPVAVFVGVLAWGWLWGMWGLFLGVPILMVIKAVCDRVDNFKAVGELLGE